MAVATNYQYRIKINEELAKRYGLIRMMIYNIFSRDRREI